MTADEVLEEFLLDPCCIDCPASDCINERRMAEEIVRWRTLDNERKARRAAREPIHSLYDILVQLSEENDDLIEERNRLRAILAMLKKPDIDVLAAAMTAWSRTGEVPAMLYAALTTAEREVANDEG